MTRWFFLVALLVSLAAGCEERESVFPGGEAESAEAGNDLALVLRVEDVSYRNRDFKNYLRLNVGEEYPSLSPVSLSRLMDGFIEEKLLLRAAKAKNVTLAWEEEKEYLAKFAGAPPLGDEERSFTEDEEQLLFDRLLVEKYTFSLVKDLQVDSREVEAYYTGNKREFLRPERVMVSQILLPSEEKAVEVLETLAGASSEEFRRRAREVSIGAEASQGGRMGVFAQGELPKEMEEVVFSLKEGEISPVFESSYGFHIFRLDARYGPELAPLEEAAPSIRTKLLRRKIQDLISEHVRELKETCDWTFYPQNLYFAYQRNTHE